MTTSNDKADLLVLRLLITVWSAILLTLALLSPAHAADLEAGKEAYRRGDFPSALREFRPLAEQGHAGAQFNLGFVYDEGWGVPQDEAEAVRWYRKAAAQGHAPAQFNLGHMYADGRGMPQGEVEAVTWYRRAAEQGDARAQNALGFMFDEGRGVPQDDVEAYAWLNIAVAQGSSSEQTRGHAVEIRDRIAQRMTLEARTRAQQLAREYWQAYVQPFRD